jgi:N-acetyl-1-D-myo-inositol-2-amino-2-deoxy-alpha-D-glucopyranoside deacetylase
MVHETRDPVVDIRAGDRWLIVVAHPDDETFGCGSLIADAARRGAEVTVVCATRGEGGERSAQIPPDADLGRVRAEELRAAAAMLGVSHVELRDYVDSGFGGDLPEGALCAAPVEQVTGLIAALIDRFTPTVMVILDASDGHRDHAHIRTCARGAQRAAGTGAPALIESCLPNRLMRRWLVEMSDSHGESAYHGIDPADFGTPDGDITDEIDHRDVLELREAAIALHRSQASPFDELSAELRHEFLAFSHVSRFRPGVARRDPAGDPSGVGDAGASA